MEAFSFLKYWRPAAGPPALPTTDNNSNAAALTATTTTAAILTAVAQTDVGIDDEDDSDDDNGPFFDLEFTLPDDSEDSPQNLNEDHTASDSENHSEDETGKNININNTTIEDYEIDDVDDDEEDGEGESEIKFTLSPSSNDHSNLSDDVIFKGELVDLEPSSFVLNSSGEPNSKPQFTASLLKSATKFRVFMLGLKKPKPNINSTSDKEKDQNGSESDPAALNPKQQRKLFTVKFKVEEVPIMSLFTRDNGSKGAKASCAASTNNKEETETETEAQTQTKAQTQAQSISSASEEKRLMQKYLRMVKPLYVKVSQRYAEKLRFSGQLNMNGSAASEKPAVEKEGDVASEGVGKGQKQGNLPLPAGLRVVCKHLGKSRSASSVAVPTQAPTVVISSKRRDDSLLQQQDGIQGAILHCKRSFNASRDCESSQLPRSVRDPLHKVLSPELSTKSMNEV